MGIREARAVWCPLAQGSGCFGCFGGFGHLHGGCLAGQLRVSRLKRPNNEIFEFCQYFATQWVALLSSRSPVCQPKIINKFILLLNIYSIDTVQAKQIWKMAGKNRKKPTNRNLLLSLLRSRGYSVGAQFLRLALLRAVKCDRPADLESARPPKSYGGWTIQQVRKPALRKADSTEHSGEPGKWFFAVFGGMASGVGGRYPWFCQEGSTLRPWCHYSWPQPAVRRLCEGGEAKKPHQNGSGAKCCAPVAPMLRQMLHLKCLVQCSVQTG